MRTRKREETARIVSTAFGLSAIVIVIAITVKIQKSPTSQASYRVHVTESIQWFQLVRSRGSQLLCTITKATVTLLVLASADRQSGEFL